ncbi:hypothetical protein F6V25_05180 [Oryzomonas japonica]|uniref:Zona occludens toxin N-terminal domain-containing protein n=1 Tax=Oryzomonas japonica TaxID=2603858 RepID=A0A7J4ZV42_9BACT|nr:zonular occludens toxin domain-containing protein [Oryzomonas japonica]KAB0666809.1 hypothetical protein F6V25_05180 [Oryzomonas japonica]
MNCAVVGVPGTGKTYFMVQYLKKHFTYNEFFREFTIAKNILILTNIDGLKLYGPSCWNIESPELLGDPSSGIKGKLTREEFFTVDNMKRIMENTGKTNIVLCIDEIQRDQYFPLGYKDKDVLFMFAYHRHIGMDIILGTQDPALICRAVLAQFEYLAHGTLRSKKFFGAMSYKFTDNKGNYMYSQTLRTDKSVFNAYQSQSVQEIRAPKNAIIHWVVVVVVLLVVAGGLFKTSLAIVAEKAKPKHPVARPAAASIPAPAASLPKTAAVQPVASSSRVPPPVIPPSTPVAAWRSYDVQGYISTGGRSYYLVNGHYLDPTRCRHYSSVTHTVEYFSLEPLADSRSVGGGRPMAWGSSSESTAKGEPLGEPAPDKPKLSNIPEFKPGVDDYRSPTGVDWKHDQIRNAGKSF